MKLTNLRPILRTNEVEETIRFYTSTLGFVLDNYVKDSGWASVSRDEVSLMISIPNAHSDFARPVFTGSFYFNTDNVDEWWEHMKGKAEVCYPIETFDYGMREFAVYDNNGYLLQFGQGVGAW